MSATSGPGTLYVVATPIGNLEDITLRALRVLKQVDAVAAEDTRHTRKLLSHYQIKAPLLSCFADKELKQGQAIVERLLQGENIALVTDAGTPGLSDPGDRLVSMALDHEVPVASVPGPSALTAALSVSGVGGSRFVFHGFLPRQTKKRTAILRLAVGRPEPQIFFAAPHKALDLLEQLAALCPQRQTVMVREISKIYEESRRGTAAEMAAALATEPPRGEIIIILGWDKDADAASETPVLPAEIHEIIVNQDISAKAATAIIAAVTGRPRRDVYQELLEYKRRDL